MPSTLDYGAAPAPGTEFAWSGQTYTVIRSASALFYGRPSGEIQWSTSCPDCGKEVRFTTGLKKAWLPKRCPACNGPDDMDRMERKAFSKNAWVERMAAARRARAGSPDALIADVKSATFNRFGMLDCILVMETGAEIPFRYKPGMDLEAEGAGIAKSKRVLDWAWEAACAARDAEKDLFA